MPRSRRSRSIVRLASNHPPTRPSILVPNLWMRGNADILHHRIPTIHWRRWVRRVSGYPLRGSDTDAHASAVLRIGIQLLTVSCATARLGALPNMNEVRNASGKSTVLRRRRPTQGPTQQHTTAIKIIDATDNALRP